MPIPKPKPKETEQDFISRCMKDLANDFTNEKQRAAICYRQWNDHKKKKKKAQLAAQWTQEVSKWPEAGMGYHRADVRFATGETYADATIYNAQEIELPEELADLEITSLKPHEA